MHIKRDYRLTKISIYRRAPQIHLPAKSCEYFATDTHTRTPVFSFLFFKNIGSLNENPFRSNAVRQWLFEHCEPISAEVVNRFLDNGRRLIFQISSIHVDTIYLSFCSLSSHERKLQLTSILLFKE